MKEFAVELNPAAVADMEIGSLSARDRVSAYVELTKPRITTLIVLTSAAGFCLAGRKVDYVALLTAMIGIALLSSGIATLNQYIERDLDRLMRRTADRPLPSGKLAPWEALWFGVCLTVLAEVYLLLLVNPLSAILGLTVIAGYLFAYTPLKTRTTLSTLVGAFPGAVPSIMSGVKLGIGMGLVLIAVAEMIGARSGLGFLIWSAWETFAVENLANWSKGNWKVLARSWLGDQSDRCGPADWQTNCPDAGGRIEVKGRSMAVLISNND